MGGGCGGGGFHLQSANTPSLIGKQNIQRGAAADGIITTTSGIISLIIAMKYITEITKDG